MNPELKKALDKELNKDRARRSKVWILLILGVVVVLAIYTPVFSESVVGETTAVSAKDRGGIIQIQLKVRLDSGDEIFVLVDNNPDHSPGQKVEVSKLTTVVGMASYQFIRFVDEDT
ncbi:MAG: hypothetical protein KTR18_14615 [Acidiferrobacterales bacterium]|nr:hypothetical protein [Acidiferrobacterales bacterium]